jgi:hypothetical protein
MPTCPKCDQPMRAAEVISLAGVQEKAVRWRCERDGTEAGAVHPVQISHLHVGDEQDEGGHRARIVKLEMQGAELLVFREPVP